jgi:hypothetical protein
VVFNKKPAMKAREICEAAKAALRSGKYKMVRGRRGWWCGAVAYVAGWPRVRG